LVPSGGHVIVKVRQVCFMVYGIGWRACILMKHLLASIAHVASEEMAAISVALQPPSSGSEHGIPRLG
jgi:hypothetical protein